MTLWATLARPPLASAARRDRNETVWLRLFAFFLFSSWGLLKANISRPET